LGSSQLPTNARENRIWPVSRPLEAAAVANRVRGGMGQEKGYPLLPRAVDEEIVKRFINASGFGPAFLVRLCEARKLGIFTRKGSKAVHILRPHLHGREEPGKGRGNHPAQLGGTSTGRCRSSMPPSSKARSSPP
jgi:hypothetical protein